MVVVVVAAAAAIGGEGERVSAPPSLPYPASPSFLPPTRPPSPPFLPSPPLPSPPLSHPHCRVNLHANTTPPSAQIAERCARKDLRNDRTYRYMQQTHTHTPSGPARNRFPLRGTSVVSRPGSNLSGPTQSLPARLKPFRSNADTAGPAQTFPVRHANMSGQA